MDPIYLDNNSTTPLLPEVVAAMQACDAEGYLNPESQHHFGRRARRALEAAREGISGLLGAACDTHPADRVIFTSGGTEANNLALRGLAGDPPGHVIVSAIEHPSVLATAEHLEHSGFEVGRLPVTRDGVVRAEALRDILRDDTRVVSVMLANNETGVLQPVAELAVWCSTAGVPLHTDAVQAVGKMSVDFRALGAAAMTVSAHKFHGPRGIGLLLLRPDVKPRPILFGGFQQEGLRPGTESVTLAVGMFAALRLWHEQRDERARRLRSLRVRLEEGLRNALPAIVIHGDAVERLPHTSNVAFPGVERQVLAVALDLACVACSTGSACASGATGPSHVLSAMGLDTGHLGSSLRFSVGATTTMSEVDEAVARIVKTYNDLQRLAKR